MTVRKEQTKNRPNIIKKDTETALAMHRNGDLSKALDAYQRLLKLEPNNPVVLNMMGVLFYQASKHTQGLAWIKKSIQIDPEYAEAYVNMSSILIELDRYSEAEKACKMAISLQPNNVTAYNNLGNIFTKNNDTNQAVKSYKKAIKISPTSSISLYNLANILENKEESIALLKKSVEANPNFTHGYISLGNAYSKISNSTKAIHYYKQAIEVESQSPEAHFNLATEYSNSGNTELAEKHFSQSLSNGRNNSISLTRLAIIKFLKEDIATCNSILKTTSPDSINELKYFKDRSFCLSYITYIKKLINFRSENKELYNKTTEPKNIIAIGESHAIGLNGLNIGYGLDCNTRIRTESIIGCKAWHLCNTKNYRARLTESHIKKVKEGEFFIICIGEIDCRNDEGIIEAHRKQKTPLNEIIKSTAAGYLKFISTTTQGRNIKPIISGVPAPIDPLYRRTPEPSSSLQAIVIKEFNRWLKTYCLKYNFLFLDIYLKTDNSSGFSDGSLHIDNVHLKPDVYIDEINRVISSLDSRARA